MKGPFVAASLLLCLLSPVIMNADSLPIKFVNVKGNIGGGAHSQDYIESIDGDSKDIINIKGTIGGGAHNRDIIVDNVNVPGTTAGYSNGDSSGNEQNPPSPGSDKGNGDQNAPPQNTPAGTRQEIGANFNLGGGANSRDSYTNVDLNSTGKGNIGGGSNSRDKFNGQNVSPPNASGSRQENGGSATGSLGGGSNSRDSYLTNVKGNIGGGSNSRDNYSAQGNPGRNANRREKQRASIGGGSNSRDQVRVQNPDPSS